MDYTGNSKSEKEPKAPAAKSEKKVEKVVTEPVVLKKKGIGRRFKGLLVEADLRSVAQYIMLDVLLPAARNTIVDATSRGIERMMYGEQAVRRRDFGPGPRITYNNPLRRQPIDPRMAPPSRGGGTVRVNRRPHDDIIFSSREEADLVLERLGDLIDQFQVATIADLGDLVGLTTSHVDHKWGWYSVVDASIQQIREGYLLALPDPEVIA